MGQTHSLSNKDKVMRNGERIEKINAGDLAKLIALCISNYLYLIADKRLTPERMEQLKQAIERDINDGTYQKAPLMYDAYVYKYLN